MSFADLGDILAIVTAPFDQLIEAKGAEIEAVLPPVHKLLVDDLDSLHWDRARAMAEVAYDTGLAIGKQLGRLPPGDPEIGASRLGEDVMTTRYSPRALPSFSVRLRASGRSSFRALGRTRPATSRIWPTGPGSGSH